ncbi:MAG: hotdog fold thioesterase [Bacteroidota bacterium]
MSDKKPSSWKIVNAMMEKDAFSQWLGIEVVVVEKGYAKLKMKVTENMLNGFGIAHGGITYSLGDSALAFASNGHGKMSVSTGTSIAHYQQVQEGDTLTAEAKETNLGEKVAHYQISIKNQDEEVVASFFGSVYRTSKDWEL